MQKTYQKAKKEGRKLREEEGLQADETPRRKKEKGVKMKRKENKGKTRNKWKIMHGKIEKTNTTGTS